MARVMTSNPRVPHLQRASTVVALGWTVLFSAACTGTVDGGPKGQSGVGGAGNVTTGGSGGATSGVGGTTAGSGTAGGTAGASVGGTGGATAGTGGAGGSAGAPVLSTGGVKLRLLTQAEYRASLQSLFGAVTTPLDLPQDTSVGGFISIGASQVTVNPTAADKYEAASRAVVAEVFGDMARWQSLVGCQPQADLSDACVETFVQGFGRRAFRRDLTDVETQQWVGVGRSAAVLAGNAAQGLSTLTSGFLQSPHFLYRVETNAVDPANGRLKYDGRSMAIRLAFFLTGGPPSAELVAAGESGQLDTADGVRAAAASMWNDPALVERLTAFFYEYTQAELVMTVEKSPTMFPDFNESLRSSMREGTRLFLERVVLAPGADVRSYFNSDQTFADSALATIYGLTPPASGFAQFTFPPQTHRAGIMGQAGVISAHSKADHSSPTARGLFMMQAFFCEVPQPPPDGVITELVIDPTLTTRERIDLHSSQPLCAGCHAMFDPMGLALEHFDSIGRYRETEDGLAIDATGTLADGTAFDGAVELGAALAGSTMVQECLLRHFYRHVNGRADDVHDQPQVEAMMASLSARNYVFRDLVADFVVSDAFRSAPALPITGENQ
jgi:hypothetical protein